jgi:hypothetical protein
MARPCVFKQSDKVGMTGTSGAIDPKFIGTVEAVQGPTEPGYYECYYVVRREDGTTFKAAERDLKKVTEP